MKEQSVNAEIRALEKRKAQLLRLERLRHEVGALELAAIGGTDKLRLMKIICEEVCREWGLPVALVMGRSRPENVTVPRHVVFYIGREKGVRPNEMATVFERDHGTICNGHERVREHMSVDQTFAVRVEAVKAACERRLAEPAMETAG